MEGRLANLIERLLDDAVAAAPALEETGRGAAVAVAAIGVITLLGRRAHAVTTGGSAEDGGQRAGGRADIARRITLLGSNRDAVAAEGIGVGGLESAGGSATIAAPGVAIVASLGRREDTIAAEGERSDERLFQKAGGGAPIVRADVAIIARFTGVDHAIPTDWEYAGDTTTVGRGVGVVGSLIALFAGIHRSIATHSETIAVAAAGVASGGLDDDAAFEVAFRMSGDTAPEIRITLVGSRSGNRDAGIALTGEVGVANIASEDRIAGVGASTGHRDAGRPTALRVLSTIHNAIAGVGAGTRNRDALVPLADGVGFPSAPEEEVALVGSGGGDDDAGVLKAFGVLCTANLQ
jgi:hypothetical protein